LGRGAKETPGIPGGPKILGEKPVCVNSPGGKARGPKAMKGKGHTVCLSRGIFERPTFGAGAFPRGARNKGSGFQKFQGPGKEMSPNLGSPVGNLWRKGSGGKGKGGFFPGGPKFPKGGFETQRQARGPGQGFTLYCFFNLAPFGII